MMNGMDKKSMHKQALMKMIKDGMGVKVKIEKGPAREIAMEDEDSMDEGMEQMMVSAEEKQMILDMRKGKDMEEGEEAADPMLDAMKKPMSKE